jgi:hypothetical protein
MDATLVQPTSVRDEALGILSRLGVPQSAFAREGLMASSPIPGELIAYVRIASPEEVSAVIGRATQAFNAWRKVPAPRRGEFVRVLAEELRGQGWAMPLVQFFRESWLGGTGVAYDDPRVNLLYADLAGLPPMNCW